MEQDEAVRIAKAAGVTRLQEEYPEAWRSALKAAANLAAQLPKDFIPAEECSHAFHLPGRAEDRR